jgi:hypothetical protein
MESKKKLSKKIIKKIDNLIIKLKNETDKPDIKQPESYDRNTNTRTC